MAQIFISYSHQDDLQARRIADELQQRGWTVWWDPSINPGESFIVLINREISAASCVVVLWSKTSVTSRWVMEEAHNGLTRDILCPVMVERDIQLPVGFATAKYVPLWEWQNGEPVGGFAPLVDELELIVGKPQAPAAATPPPAVSTPAEPIANEAPAAPSRPPQREAAPASAPASAPSAPPARPGPAPRTARIRFVDLSDLTWMHWPLIAGFLGALGLMALSTFGRYALNAPMSDAFELGMMLLGCAGLLGAVLAERSGRNIRSPISVLLFRGGANRARAIVQGLAGAAVFGLVAWFMVRRTGIALEQDALRPYDMPQAPLAAVAAVAFLLLAILGAVALVRAVRGAATR